MEKDKDMPDDKLSKFIKTGFLIYFTSSEQYDSIRTKKSEEHSQISEDEAVKQRHMIRFKNIKKSYENQYLENPNKPLN